MQIKHIVLSLSNRWVSYGSTLDFLKKNNDIPIFSEKNFFNSNILWSLIEIKKKSSFYPY